MKNQKYRLGVDVGGTFTDFVLSSGDGSNLAFHKEPSIPQDPALAVEMGTQHLIRTLGISSGAIELVVHGTTLGLNAIIQQRGAKVALIVSRGNRDVMEIARARMPNSYDFTAGREAPLIPRESVFEVSSRGLADGSILTDIDELEISKLAEEIRKTGHEAVAVMLLNSYANADLENRLCDFLREKLDTIPVSASSEIWPEMREYERALVTCMNMYIRPLKDQYLEGLKLRLDKLGIIAPVYITANNGGTISIETARNRPIDTILSGPASGVLAATHVSKGNTSLITFDMGGTSTDISICRQGSLEFSHSTLIGDYPLMLPVVNVTAIGAGGGSIIWSDPQGILKVGPESSGAEPGPVCYGRGGKKPTITDAYLTLGLLDEKRFNAGRMELDKAAAAAALKQIAQSIGLKDETEASEAAIRVTTAKMATELRKLMAQNGLDPRGFILIAYGGAGPTHANFLAEEARLDSVLVPRLPGTFCALGAILADVRRDYVRPARQMIDRSGNGWKRIYERLLDAEKEALEWINKEGNLIGDNNLKLTCDMRYPAQAFELSISVPDYNLEKLSSCQIIDLFNREHERLYGFHEPDSEVQITNLRLSVVGRVEKIKLIAKNIKSKPEPEGYRRIFNGRWQSVPVYSRDKIGQGTVIEGPAIIEQPDSTIVLLSQWFAKSDKMDNLLLKRLKSDEA